MAVHCLSDPVRHEPCTSVGAEAERPHKLVRAETFLRARVQPEAQQPLVDGDMRPLHHGADAHRELFAALFAVEPARPHRLAAKHGNRDEPTAERAGRTIRPADRLKRDPRLLIIVVAGMVEVRGKGVHGLSS